MMCWGEFPLQHRVTQRGTSSANCGGLGEQIFEKSTLHREIGAALYVAPNCTAALGHLDVHPEDYKGNYYRGVGSTLTQ